MNIKLSKKIFNDRFFPYLDDTARTQLFYGGSSSGKSVFLAQRCIYDILKGQRNYLICRNVSNSLRSSTFQEIRKTINAWNLEDYFKVNIGSMVITCLTNNRQIIFKGLDDVSKIKSITPSNGVITDIWIEEATETTFEAFKQLKKRLRGRTIVKKRIILSFNPIIKTHWIFKEFFTNYFNYEEPFRTKDKLILKTTYLDNKFLSSDDVEELEGEKDPYWYSVYTLGNWGVLGDTIFRNWKVEHIPRQIKDKFDCFKNGLDFGYSNDPFAFIRTHYDKKHKIIYVLHEIYQKKLTNEQIAQVIKPIIYKEYVTCDSAEPKSIKELQNFGINTIPAKKGKDSILHGIQWLQGHRIIIDDSCQNMINELQLYTWKSDKNSVSLPIPVDKNNHLIDAIRYAYELDMNYTTLKMVKIKGI